jgi:hypothetical protein
MPEIPHALRAAREHALRTMADAERARDDMTTETQAEPEVAVNSIHVWRDPPDPDGGVPDRHGEEHWIASARGLDVMGEPVSFAASGMTAWDALGKLARHAEVMGFSFDPIAPAPAQWRR